MAKSALVLGPSGIGKAHIRVLTDYGIKNIYLKGNKFKPNRINIMGLKKNINVNFYNLKNLKELKKKIQISSICTPFEKHLSHILLLKKFCNRIIVEKPFIWRNNSKNNYEVAKKVLEEKSKKKIFINLPMVSLASQIKKIEKLKKINNLKFNYFTAGKQKFNNIAVDLLPHAISFFFTFNKDYKRISVFKILKKKDSWSCKIKIDDCKCNFKFIQNKKRRISKLSFKINKNLYVRKQIKVANNYQVSLIKNSSKEIKLSNPLQEYLLLILKNLDNGSFQKENNRLALNTVKFTQMILSKGTK